MLKALYDYAERHHLAIPPGFAYKSVKAFISLSSADPDYVGVQMEDNQREYACPDVASNVPDRSGVLVEKRSDVIPEESTPKSRFFLESLRSASAYDSTLSVCVHALETPEIAEKIRAELDRHKVKPSERVSFKVDGANILESEAIPEWWAEFGKQFDKSGGKGQTLCLITGKETVPMMTTPPVKGLYAVGGFGNGDALISFDKQAFCSYDLKKAANAPVSEEAFIRVKLALDDLLKDAPALAVRKAAKVNREEYRSTYSLILSGMKFVHWFSREIDPEDDPIYQSEDFFGWGEETEEDTENAEDTADHSAISDSEERDLRKVADNVPESVLNGKRPAWRENTRYYILLLSGVNGRVMIRRYEEGDYEDLRKNLDKWHEDLKLIRPSGLSNVKDRKLFTRLIRLIGYRKNDRKAFDRVRDELSGLTAAVIHAILNGTPLPDTIAARALAYIRSQMLSGTDENGRSRQIPDSLACQWLKVWLIRHPYDEQHPYNQEVQLMEEYNMQSKSVPYHCGGMMAIFAEIQNAAMGDVNASIVERYYASAIQTPALVIGQLSKLSNFHLSKLDDSKKGLSVILRRNLLEVSAAIPSDTLPATLKLEEQSAFALGYYQMGAKLNREWAERKAAKQEKSIQQQNSSGDAVKTTEISDKNADYSGDADGEQMSMDGYSSKSGN